VTRPKKGAPRGDSADDRPTDRRVRRTHRRLKEALLELIEERDYDGITIEEITERADVARSTFYSHFGSKEDLLFRGFDAWVEGLAEGPPQVATTSSLSARSASAEDPPFRFSLPLLRHMAGQDRFVRALLLSHGGRLRRRLTELLAQVSRRELERGGTASRSLSPAAVRDAQAALLTSAFLGLAGWWLTSAKRLPPEAIDEIFQRTVGGAR
jgi:AcrR family transcriptional regulator